MKKPIFFVAAISIMALSCNTNPQKDIEVTVSENSTSTEKTKPEVHLSVQTNKEQTFWFYSAGDFVAESKPEDATIMPIPYTIVFDGNNISISEKERYQVIDYEYHAGKVFKDAGEQEIYTITAKLINEDGTLHNWPSTITIIKVSADNGTKNIVKVTRFDVDGDLYGLTIYTD